MSVAAVPGHRVVLARRARLLALATVLYNIAEAVLTLAVFVTYDAVTSLAWGKAAEHSTVGMVLAVM